MDDGETHHRVYVGLVCVMAATVGAQERFGS